MPMKVHVFLLSFLLLACMAETAASAEGSEKGALDGEVFLVERGEMGKPSDGKDTYIFRNGMSRSANYEKDYEFAEGTYTATRNGATITFAADTGSDSQGWIHWEGTVLENRIDVRYTWAGKKQKWYQSNPRVTEHWARSVTEWATEDPRPPGGGASLEPSRRENVPRQWRGKRKRGRSSGRLPCLSGRDVCLEPLHGRV